MNAPTIIRHPYGNVLRLSIPLTLRTTEIIDGQSSYTDSEFIPDQNYPVQVILSEGSKKYAYVPTVDGNIVSIEDKGNIATGSYAVTVLCKDSNGDPMRFKAKLVLEVVDSTEDAQAGGIGWYDGLDGQSVYPILSRNSNG